MAPGDAPARSVLSGPPPAHEAERHLWREPRRVQVHRPTPKRDVPYVPTAEPVVEAILDFAGVGPGDVLYDLGCGDGRIPIGAARRGACGVGVDIDRLRVRECHWNAQRAGPDVEDRLQFIRGSLFEVDLRPASVVTLYLLPSINLRLRPRLLWELKPGSRVVSNYFDMGDWKPDATLEAHRRVLYRWTIPAWVEGRWDCVEDAPEGRGRVVLELRRKYQLLSGATRLGRSVVPLREAKLEGNSLSFVLRDWRRGGRGFRYTAVLRDGYLRGQCQPEEGGPAWPWGGVRHG
jgi:precorrin-6B methylase 2